MMLYETKSITGRQNRITEPKTQRHTQFCWAKGWDKSQVGYSLMNRSSPEFHIFKLPSEATTRQFASQPLRKRAGTGLEHRMNAFMGDWEIWCAILCSKVGGSMGFDLGNTVDALQILVLSIIDKHQRSHVYFFQWSTSLNTICLCGVWKWFTRYKRYILCPWSVTVENF